MQRVILPSGGIVTDVSAEMVQFTLIADDAFPISALPQFHAGGAVTAVDPRGTRGFETRHDRPQ